MKRRDFLKFGSAGMFTAVSGTLGLVSWTPRAYAANITKEFWITQGTQTMITGETLYLRGFSSSSTSLNVPGESFIVQENDMVTIKVHNTLSTPHSFVIDGMVNTGPINPGQTATVTFKAINPGSYLYYDNVSAPYNMMIGLHGGFAVMPYGKPNQMYAGSPTFVQQYFWIFNDYDLNWNNAIKAGKTPPSTYTPRYFTLNGLGSRPPGAPGHEDPNIDALDDPRSDLRGSIGDRTLIRMFNVGRADESVHCHGNHMEWLTENGQVRPNIWLKDCIYLEGNLGAIDAIYPFESPPDAYPSVKTSVYPMHLHTEMSQTAGGGYYMFGALTDIHFE